MDYATSEGRLDAAKWLHANRSEGCSSNAIVKAASNGHLGMVKWLHKELGQPLSSAAMLASAAHGHLEVVKYLHNFKTEKCSTTAIIAAKENGNRAIVTALMWRMPTSIEGGIARMRAQWSVHVELEVAMQCAKRG